MKFGNTIRKLREDQGLVLRKVAAQLDIDTATLSKIELGDRYAKRDHLKILSHIFSIDVEELEKIWLSDKIYGIIKNENQGLQALNEAKSIYIRKQKVK